MLVLRGVSTPAPSATVLTIGNFDGVHMGHRALLRRLTDTASQCGLPAAVLTFEPHPREFFAPASAPARLTTLREKLELLQTYGVDLACVCRFNDAFAALTADQFIEKILVQGLKVRHLMIGDDFRFGARRTGDFALLQQAGDALGFRVEAMESVLSQDERASSSGVREALANGDMERAARLLGRPYSIDGRVVHGQKLGRQLGFATANIRIKHNPLPLTGVFAVRATGAGPLPLNGVANLGVRPTVGGELKPLLEVHLFDFDGDIYGAHLSVSFLHKLRDEMKFPDFSALVAQIGQDAEAAHAFFQR
ncbi:MAG TPA: bifunctional riboflavin kinase/FAD synthetase [Azospira sp.]|nr:bifunctional riboflavin kinase/FAD synthetase [Azospira sp.]